MAGELAARGLRAGDRLCVQLPNGLEFLDLFLACVRTGVILVPINVLYRERELSHILRDAEPKAFVHGGAAPAVAVGGVESWDLRSLTVASKARPSGRQPAELAGDTPALIVYTSGTTGAAKGAVLSHAALAANGRNVISAWRITEAERYLAVLPLFHVHGLANGVHAWLASGCLMRLTERFDHRRAAQLFTEFRPTLCFGVPTIYHRLLDRDVVSDDTARAIGRAARLFVSGSAPLPAHVLEAFRSRYGHVILERYGMSETLMIATNPLDGERRPGSVGHPFPGVTLRITDESGAEVADGSIGEVQVRSPSLFSGYWRNRQATEAAFIDGWFRTGDLGQRSPDGYLSLRGRRGDLIISGGFNIYPREIEEVLLEDARVREAVVIGVADERRGEVPVAYVVVDGELDAA
ncbi:MAG TPA: AMP-binding protein, partial [Thermoanaerobaculia bacterium]|nr:AMP-binding protein [Thermoanaerobaculia bacterium]